jgi:nitrogen fixation/metabolism regulation signal transduction histidine kinase
MLANKFGLLTILRVLLLTVTIFVLAALWGNEELFFTQIVIVVTIIIEIAELIRFVNNTNRELSRFFVAIRHNDFSVSFKRSPLGSSFSDLQQSMHAIIDTYKTVNLEREAQSRLLGMLVQQISVGIIMTVNDEIAFINPAAQQLLGVEGVKSWGLLSQMRSAFAQDINALGSHGKKMIEMKDNGETKIVAVDVSTQEILGKQSRLITIHDINAEIEQKEIEAWHKLIKILTHEIMNSITPISSLTETMQGMLTDKAGKQRPLEAVTQETLADMLFSLNTIHARSESLLQFVENYRRISRVPEPLVENINIENFVAGIGRLMGDTMRKHSISWSTSTDGPLIRRFDPGLLQQVIINLITNSIHAVEGRANKAILFKAYDHDGRLAFDVTDNGKGISESDLKEIFIPFFSTKRDGSGIGLSLSKQIISKHGGTIKVSSRLGLGTTFHVTLGKSNGVSTHS